MSGRPPVVYNKSIPFKWKARGHGGKVGAICARTIPGIGTNGTAGAHVFTGGADGIIRVWDQKGRIICETTNVSTAITCMRFSNENVPPPWHGGRRRGGEGEEEKREAERRIANRTMRRRRAESTQSTRGRAAGVNFATESLQSLGATAATHGRREDRGP